MKERGEKAQLANECALLIHFEAFLKRKYWWELRKTNLQRAGGELFFIFFFGSAILLLGINPNVKYF